MRSPFTKSIPADAGLVAPLFFARALTVSFLNPFRRAAAENASGQIVVQVKWGRDK